MSGYKWRKQSLTRGVGVGVTAVVDHSLGRATSCEGLWSRDTIHTHERRFMMAHLTHVLKYWLIWVVCVYTQVLRTYSLTVWDPVSFRCGAVLVRERERERLLRIQSNRIQVLPTESIECCVCVLHDVWLRLVISSRGMHGAFRRDLICLVWYLRDLESRYVVLFQTRPLAQRMACQADLA